ncbi:MAG: glycerophosphodiester phosphodiesterase family protein, partial [Gammaproteobacteria bacterium]
MESLKFKQHVIAHRGASFYAPENTMAAFQKAVDLGIEWIELDVALTKDNHPIIIHDDTLNRTTNGVGDVGLYTLAQLKGLDAGSWFAPAFHQETLPTLTELTSFLEKTNTYANVELKSLPGREETLVLAVLREMSAYLNRYNSRILFSSFSVPTLMLLRGAASNVRIGLLMEEWLPDWQVIASKLHCVSIH